MRLAAPIFLSSATPNSTPSAEKNYAGETGNGPGNTADYTYTPNALNQYTAVGTASPVHDADGNLTDDGTTLYAWDAENRLVMVQRKSDNAVIAEYRYDYMSRRVYKETTAIAPQGASATLFHYEGWNLCAEYTANSTTTPATITTLKRTYTWGMDLSGSMQGAGGVGGLLAIEEKTGPHTGKYYPLYDGNGNVTELVKDNGTGGTTLVAHYEYDPFGNLTPNDDTDSSGYNAINPFKFSTKYHDQETDFYYYGYRYYDPKTGRWPSRDPIGENGGFNLYGFVENDGIGGVDVLGLKTENNPPVPNIDNDIDPTNPDSNSGGLARYDQYYKISCECTADVVCNYAGDWDPSDLNCVTDLISGPPPSQLTIPKALRVTSTSRKWILYNIFSDMEWVESRRNQQRDLPDVVTPPGFRIGDKLLLVRHLEKAQAKLQFENWLAKTDGHMYCKSPYVYSSMDNVSCSCEILYVNKFDNWF